MVNQEVRSARQGWGQQGKGMVSTGHGQHGTWPAAQLKQEPRARAGAEMKLLGKQGGQRS